MSYDIERDGLLPICKKCEPRIRKSEREKCKKEDKDNADLILVGIGQERTRIKQEVEKWLKKDCPHGYHNDFCPKCTEELLKLLEAK